MSEETARSRIYAYTATHEREARKVTIVKANKILAIGIETGHTTHSKQDPSYQHMSEVTKKTKKQ